MLYDYIDTPYGDLLVAGSDKGLGYANFAGGKYSIEPASHWVKNSEFLKPVRKQIDAYFNGELRHFDLKLAPEGTDFQCRVWDELRKIPYGETRSYGELAATIGNPKASRAVGSANGKNPIVIIQPCHRVIGSSGSLTGFAYGVDMKKGLLKMEGYL